MTAITNNKLRDKIMEEKALELKKKIELIKQNTYENKVRKKNEKAQYWKLWYQRKQNKQSQKNQYK